MRRRELKYIMSRLTVTVCRGRLCGVCFGDPGADKGEKTKLNLNTRRAFIYFHKHETRQNEGKPQHILLRLNCGNCERTEKNCNYDSITKQ